MISSSVNTFTSIWHSSQDWFDLLPPGWPICLVLNPLRYHPAPARARAPAEPRTRRPCVPQLTAACHGKASTGLSKGCVDRKARRGRPIWQTEGPRPGREAASCHRWRGLPLKRCWELGKEPDLLQSRRSWKSSLFPERLPGRLQGSGAETAAAWVPGTSRLSPEAAPPEARRRGPGFPWGVRRGTAPEAARPARPERPVAPETPRPFAPQLLGGGRPARSDLPRVGTAPGSARRRRGRPRTTP